MKRRWLEREPSRVSIGLGRGLQGLGLLTLPLLVGVAVGFYASDQGVPWLPSMLEVILVAAVLALLAIGVGRYLQGKAFETTRWGRHVRQKVAISLGLAWLAAAARLALFWAEVPSPLTRLQRHEFNEAFAVDAQRLRELQHGLDAAIRSLEERGLSSPQAPAGVPGADREQAALQIWAGIYRQAFVLDHLRAFYEDWYRFDPSRNQRSQHLRSFLLSFAAELTLYEAAGRLLDGLQANPTLVRFLDTPHPEAGLPAGSLSLLRQQLRGTRDLARVVAGAEYLALIEAGLAAREEARELGCLWMWQGIERRLKALRALPGHSLALSTVDSDLDQLRRGVRRRWYPAQSRVAEWMGDTRLRRIGRYLITPAQLDVLRRELQPGDVLLSRKNWYLSNVALPGFWPHAILYVGRPDQLGEYFDVPEVRGLVGELSGTPGRLDHYLRQRWPTHWQALVEGQEGRPGEVMEAISEGVVFNTLEHAAGDYLVALRPELGRRAKAQALLGAFRHAGKPYDFDFDFATEHALVCTELVWRAYRPATDKPGLHFQLVRAVGRWTLPANEIARQFSQANPSGGGTGLSFVYFLDGREHAGHAVISDEASFRASHRRLQWDILQE